MGKFINLLSQQDIMHRSFLYKKITLFKFNKSENHFNFMLDRFGCYVSKEFDLGVD